MSQARRLHHRAGNSVEDVDAQIHLHPGQAHRLALFGAAAIFSGVHRLGGVGIDADLVAPFAAEHLVDRNVVDLAGDVPQRHLHCAHSAGLARVAAKLRDLLEQVIDAQRILAEHAALEHHRVLRARDIAHLAQAVDALVGVDADQHARTRPRLHDHRIAHVGDLQARRARGEIHILDFRLSFRNASNGACQQASRGRFEHAAAVDAKSVRVRHFK